MVWKKNIYNRFEYVTVIQNIFENEMIIGLSKKV